MTQDDLKLVLEALKWCHGGEPCGTAEAIAVVEKALAQEQEPVAWARYSRYTGKAQLPEIVFKKPDGKDWLELYTHPPQRTWVGLFDDEIMQIWGGIIKYAPSEVRIKYFARAIESKLKEINT
jgi:hypothetical protein